MVDLGFDIHLGGRAAKALSAEVTRELTSADLGLLSTERGIKPTHVQRITNRHHALARCLATGMSATEAGLVTGYTAGRISILRGDPSFEELIAFYQREKGLAVQDYQEKLINLRGDAVDVLHDRLEQDPDSFGVDALLDIGKFAADRSGAGPQSKTSNTHVHTNLGDLMKVARERALTHAAAVPGEGLGRSQVSHEAGSAPQIIEGDFTEVKR